MNYSFVEDIFGSFGPVVDTLIGGTFAYIGLIIWLRISGKRTLSKWNSFDYVVTIALGSILASVLVTPSLSVFQTMTSIGLLVTYQFGLTWLSVRSGIVQNVIKAKPSLLLLKGEFIEGSLKRERVAKGEILAAIRLSGCSCVEDIDAVVLETDGSFSVMRNLDIARATALRDIEDFRNHVITHMHSNDHVAHSVSGMEPL